MKSNNQELRRATPENLPELKKLWWQANLNPSVLSGRVTDFQIVIEDGKIIAALGLRIVGKQGNVYGEAIVDAKRADELRSALWPRFQTWAKNLGLFRLWTSLSSPFWSKCGFNPVPDGLNMPPEFKSNESSFLILQLGPEPPAGAAALAEFAMMKEDSRGRRKRYLGRIEVIAAIVTALATGIHFLHVMLHPRVRPRSTLPVEQRPFRQTVSNEMLIQIATNTPATPKSGNE